MDPPVISANEEHFGHLFCKVATYLPLSQLAFEWYLDKEVLPEENDQTLVATRKGNYFCTISSDHDVASSLPLKFRE